MGKKKGPKFGTLTWYKKDKQKKEAAKRAVPMAAVQTSTSEAQGTDDPGGTEEPGGTRTVTMKDHSYSKSMLSSSLETPNTMEAPDIDSSHSNNDAQELSAILQGDDCSTFNNIEMELVNELDTKFDKYVIIQEKKTDPVVPDNALIHGVTVNHTKVDEIACSLSQKLPALWGVTSSSAGLHILKYSPHVSRVVQRSIFINLQSEMQVFIHGVTLAEDHEFFKKCTPPDLTMDSALCVNVLLKIVSVLRVFEVCTGVTKLKYERFWKKINGCTIDKNNFHEERFQKSCRSDSCEMIVQQSRRVCDSCQKVSKTLQKKLSATPVPVPEGEKQKTPHKNKPLLHLTTPERKARFQRLTKTIRNLKRINERLRKKLEDLVGQEGIDLDDETDESLQDIITDPENQEQITDFHKLFLQQQLQARNVNGRTGMKWHPLMIRFALYLKMKAGQSAYKELRNFIHLPHERTLYDYSQTIEVKEGAHDGLIKNVAERVDQFKHEYQRFHVLLFDEIYIQQNLATRKCDGTLVGYCHLDSVMEEMLQLERNLDAAVEQVQVTPLKSPPMAKTVLTYMVKGVASNIHHPIASYSSSCLNKEDLYDHTWEVIEMCETNDIYICAAVCDGSGVNRAFIDMHTPKTKTDSGVVFDTVNPYAKDRDLFFLSDPPHLLKTIRNCFANSGMQKKGTRKLHKNGQDIVWSTIISLYNLKATQTIKKLHKLDAACVFLNKFSVMKVRYAARVLSDSVASALEEKNWPGTSETCIFKKD